MTKRRRRKSPSSGSRAAGESTEGVEIPIQASSDDRDGPDEDRAEVPAPEVDAATSQSAGSRATGSQAEDVEPEARVQGLEDRVKRLQAEFLNETKRIARQADEGRKYAVESLVTDLVPLFDALHSARAGLGPTEAGEGGAPGGAEAVRTGLDLVERELLNVLSRHGVEPIEAAECPFDPMLHEALFVVDDPRLAPGTVAQVLRPGFLLNGRVVRATQVAVTRQAEGGAPTDAPESAS